MCAPGRTSARHRYDPEAWLSQWRNIWSTGALGLLAVAFGHSREAGAEVAPDDASQSIIGGTDSDDEAVVWLGLPDGSGCSGTLVAPRVVLSAAHCLAGSVRNRLVGGEVRFGADTMTDARAIEAMYVHQEFTGVVPPGNFDIGLVRLAEPAPAGIVPLVVNEQMLDSSIVGMTVRAVGFGESNAITHAGGGIRRTVDMRVVDWGAGHLYMGTALYNTCRGDSGGPVLGVLDAAAGEVILGVSSFGPIACNGPSAKTRVDIYTELVAEVIAAWDGPCAHDGICPADTSMCAFADPDCDGCGLDGVCLEDCPRPDLDCPRDPCDGTGACGESGCAIARPGALSGRGDNAGALAGAWIVAFLAWMLFRRRSRTAR